MSSGIIGTVSKTEFGVWEWTIPNFLSQCDNGTARGNDSPVKRFFSSPDFGSEEEYCRMRVTIASNGSITVTLLWLFGDCCIPHIIRNNTFAVFLGCKKSDGTVEDRFLSPNVNLQNLRRIAFCLHRFELEARQSDLLSSGALTVTFYQKRTELDPVEIAWESSTGSMIKLGSGKWEWRIPNFLFSLKRHPRYILSPCCRDNKCEWVLLVQHAYGSILVYVRLIDCFCDLQWSCSFGLMKADGTVEERFCSRPRTLVDDSFQLVYRLPSHEMNDRVDDFLPSGTLTVIYSIEFVALQQDSLAEFYPTPYKNTGVVNLMEDYKKLLLNEEDTDVVLNVKGKEFKAHQVILKARSPVLSATFEHDMVEKRTGTVVIDDCDPESFPDFLLFLYAGETPKYPSSDHALNLYKTAHKYDVPYLQEECVKYLMGRLTDQNVCEVMRFAHQYDIDELQEVAENFFLKNASAIAQSSEFGTFMASNVRAAQRLVALLAKTKK